MAVRAFLGCLILGASLLLALPSTALAGGKDGGAAGVAREDRARHDDRGKDRDEVERPVAPERDPRQRRRREQAKFALVLVGSALGVYVAYKLVRR